jgi:hypothetical protein
MNFFCDVPRSVLIKWIECRCQLSLFKYIVGALPLKSSSPTRHMLSWNDEKRERTCSLIKFDFQRILFHIEIGMEWLCVNVRVVWCFIRLLLSSLFKLSFNENLKTVKI